MGTTVSTQPADGEITHRRPFVLLCIVVALLVFTFCVPFVLFSFYILTLLKTLNFCMQVTHSIIVSPSASMINTFWMLHASEVYHHCVQH